MTASQALVPFSPIVPPSRATSPLSASHLTISSSALPGIGRPSEPTFSPDAFASTALPSVDA